MKESRSHFTYARSCSRALNRVPARAKPPPFHPDVFVKRRPLQCSFMLFVIRGFDVLDSGVLGVISDLSASRIHLLSKWCMILDKIAALFVPVMDITLTPSPWTTLMDYPNGLPKWTTLKWTTPKNTFFR